jgi:DNA-binding PadR family transcriptional regulator
MLVHEFKLLNLLRNERLTATQIADILNFDAERHGHHRVASSVLAAQLDRLDDVGFVAFDHGSRGRIYKLTQRGREYVAR